MKILISITVLLCLVIDFHIAERANNQEEYLQRIEEKIDFIISLKEIPKFDENGKNVGCDAVCAFGACYCKDSCYQGKELKTVCNMETGVCTPLTSINN